MKSVSKMTKPLKVENSLFVRLRKLSCRTHLKQKNDLARGVVGNESGLTLIEIMIVSVIAVVLGLAIAEMQSQQAKTTKRLEVKTSAQDFYNVLKFQIVNSAVQTANQTNN